MQSRKYEDRLRSSERRYWCSFQHKIPNASGHFAPQRQAANPSVPTSAQSFHSLTRKFDSYFNNRLLWHLRLLNLMSLEIYYTTVPAVYGSNISESEDSFYWSIFAGSSFWKTYLSLEELLYFLCVGLRISSNINRFGFCLFHPDLESTLNLFEVWQAHVHGKGHSSAAVIAHTLRWSHEVRPSRPIL